MGLIPTLYCAHKLPLVIYVHSHFVLLLYAIHILVYIKCQLIVVSTTTLELTFSVNGLHLRNQLIYIKCLLIAIMHLH